MQTLTIDIQDNFMQEFLHFVELKKEKIFIKKDKNMEEDPYFYQRKRKLEKTRENIKNSTITMLSHDDVWDKVHKHLETIPK